MPNLKDAIYLAVVLIAYGLVGHLDYQDEVTLEQARATAVAMDCDPHEAFDVSRGRVTPIRISAGAAPANAKPPHDALDCY